MIESSSFYVPLATRQGFNCSVRHIQQSVGLDELCTEEKVNLADAVNELVADKTLNQNSPAAVLSVLLLDKWHYSVKSKNLSKATTNGVAVFEEVKKWKAVDLVIAYHHPDLGLVLINPKNPAYAETLGEFRKNELAVIYAGGIGGAKCDQKIADAAVDKLIDLLEGKKVKAPESFLKGNFIFVAPPSQQKAVENAKKAAKAVKATGKSKVAKGSGRTAKNAAASAAMPDFAGNAATSETWKLESKQTPEARVEQTSAAALVPPPVVAVARKLTPLYSVPVTNELFHNGNVEAWKRIINSFRAKYPHLDVYVYYDGERIIDINTLFKWGKVKHGSVIQFAVAGEGAKDVAKLQRYFNQGASPQFEAFLHGSPNTVMNLF